MKVNTTFALALFGALTSAAGALAIPVPRATVTRDPGSESEVGRDCAGQSGGATHALAVAALAPQRVVGVLSLSAVAPYWEGPDADGADWFAGMHDPAALRAARVGRRARTEHAETAQFDEAMFTARDWQVLNGPWGALGADSERAGAFGVEGEIDDDLAYASPWGVELAGLAAPTLLVHGDADRVVPVSHGRALARALPDAEYRELPGEGHISPLAGFQGYLDAVLARL